MARPEHPPPASVRSAACVGLGFLAYLGLAIAIRRSSVRPCPRDEPEDGLHREDVKGDGRVLFMCLRDPNGFWKAPPDDPPAFEAAQVPAEKA